MGLDFGLIANIVVAACAGLFLLATLTFVASLLWGYFKSGKSAQTIPALAVPPITPPTTTTVPQTLGGYLAPLNALPEGQLLGKALLSEIQQIGAELGKSLFAGLVQRLLTPLLPPPPAAPTSAPPPTPAVIDNGQAALQSQLASLQAKMETQSSTIQAQVNTLMETMGKLSGTVPVHIDPSQLQARA